VRSGVASFSLIRGRAIATNSPQNEALFGDTAAWLKLRAGELGFSGVGIAPAIELAGASRLREWLALGHHGEMAYLNERREAYADPQSVLDGARTLVLLTLDYYTGDHGRERGTASAEKGRVARYAWGSVDYHELIHGKLEQLKKELALRHPEAALRGVVDTAPLLEREYAQLAGLGWQGKNTLLLSPARGSYFFLACLLTSLDLPVDAPATTDHCGTCTACLDACPTDAFVAPNLLDARKCISYLTIELKGPVPRELRPQMGNWLFGCDVCQEVCPWNRFATPTEERGFAAREGDGELDAAELLMLTEETFRARFRKTPLWRPKRRGILRNAAIVLGNAAGPLSARAVEALLRGLDDAEPLVRGACAWAIGRHLEERFGGALRRRMEVEEDAGVREEIGVALSDLRKWGG
jgi:epoxyqueuosine reductase